MFRLPEHTLRLSAYILCLAAAACNRESPPPGAPKPAAAAAQPASAAAELLHTEQRDDILQGRRQAKAEVSTQDIADVQIQAASAPAAASADLAELNPVCRQYYQRADACFALQGADADPLRRMNDDALAELAQQQPDDTACTVLNRSFDDVAALLGCQ